MTNRNYKQGMGNSLLLKIQEVDFAIYEIVLYLDAYPCSQEALNQYHALVNARKALVNQYETEIGPLTNTCNQSKTSWDWVSTAWPWELK